MNKVLILILAVLIGGCSSVTMRTDQADKTRHPPAFQQSYDYWWWGLKGEHSVNVREACQGKNVTQVQSVTTIPNLLATIFTLGIYQPRSARIWCEGDQDA